MARPPLVTGAQVPEAPQKGSYNGPTAGLAPGYLQSNSIVLPSRYAADFRSLCERNPVPCPLIAESSHPGGWNALKSFIPNVQNLISLDLDLRRDIGRYMVYCDGCLVKSGCEDIVDSWAEDHVAFLNGCSFSVETALGAAGLAPLHVVYGCNVPMYRTTVPLNPAGVFTAGTYVVSLRAYNATDLNVVRRITLSYAVTHGEPIAWGWDAVRKLGIKDLDVPE